MSHPFRVPPDLLTSRRKRGVSLEEIASSTKIRVHYLQCIENGDFAQLPGGIYATNYIRQYARAIDYDEEELLEYYYRATGREPVPAEPTRPKRPSGVRVWLVRVLG